MRWGAGALVLLALSACASAPGPRTLGVAPTPTTPVRSDSYPVPSPSWPLRQGELPPTVGIPIPTAPAVWKDPSSPVALPTAAVATLVPAPGPDLPLPAVVPLPLKLTPVSRSWTRVAQAKTETVLPAPPAPVAATPAPSPTPVKTSDPKAKADTKAPATVAATPQPKPTPKPTSPPTPASTATILPTDTKTTGSDFQWEDVNAVAGDAVTLHFDKTNWLYLDTPTQQKAVGFQSINRDKDATTFQFRPLVPGQYTLEFQRQDLVNQSTEARKVRLAVVPAGTRTSSTGTVLSPQTSTVPANDALEMARQLAASGKTSEAVQKLLQTYRADDARTNLELARLLDQDGQDDQALTYLDKNLTLTGPDFQGTLELGTKLAATAKDPQKELPAYVKLWMAGTTAPPEDLYLQVLSTLRSQKLTAQARDWVARYTGWYPGPKLRDQYLFQLGQLLEEPGDGRDVKGAWKAYDEVVRSYPLSPFWKAAGERAAYLNRHFLQVR